MITDQDWSDVLDSLLGKGQYSNAFELIKQSEGWRASEYLDTEGNPTVGWGFNRKAYPMIPKKLTKQDAMQYMIPIFADALNRARDFAGIGWNKLSPSRKDVLLDMSYNLGNKLYGFQDMQRAVWADDMKRAAYEMKRSNWYKQVGNRSKRNIANWLRG